MFLHLGSHISVDISDIIGIFDLDNVSTSRITRDFLKAAEEDGMIVPVGSELPKSLVVCCPKGSWQRRIVSAFAPWGLSKRMKQSGFSKYPSTVHLQRFSLGSSGLASLRSPSLIPT